MSAEPLRTILWVRWRSFVNRFRRVGLAGRGGAALLVVLAAIASLGSFAYALTVGLEELPIPPSKLFGIWTGATVLFLFAWTVGLVTDLQRSDALSLRHFLHLPVRLPQAILFNYLGSFVSVSIALFVPAMLGLSLAMIATQGPLLALSLVLLAAFLVMVTGVTYLFRGWLAKQMQDKRRARSVIAGVTFGFVLLAQLPNVVLQAVGPRQSPEELLQEFDEARELHQAAQGEGEEAESARRELDRREAEDQERERVAELWVSRVALALPPGWLPYGIQSLAQGRGLAAILCACGMLGIGVLSLRRSFRTTLALALGEERPTRDTEERPGERTGSSSAPRRPWIERGVPLVGDRVASIVWATLTGSSRAPEVRLVLMGPLVLLLVFGTMLLRGERGGVPDAFRPFLGLAAIGMGLINITQLLQNQFGLDRAGFRAYVLSPVPRSEILLAKNLSVAPLGLGFGLLALLALEVFVPSGPVRFAGSVMQLVSGYLLLCLLCNHTSILWPMRLRENTLHPAGGKSKAFFLQLASLLWIPLSLSPLALPSVAEIALRRYGLLQGVPIHLAGHAVLLLCTFSFYRWLVRRQGRLLQEREQDILDVLTH